MFYFNKELRALVNYDSMCMLFQGRKRLSVGMFDKVINIHKSLVVFVYVFSCFGTVFIAILIQLTFLCFVGPMLIKKRKDREKSNP